MQQFITMWNSFDSRKQIMVVAATIGTFAAILSLVFFVSRPSMVLLYGGLDPASAGEITQSLDSQNVPYRIQGTSIFVDETQRDSLRLSLASQGLPDSGVSGYELLDDLNGFGTTTQMFNATYLRAKEGELARTIQASPQIRSARVHISQEDKSPFRRSAAASASVSLKLQGGAVISASHAKALQFLVASAVTGLEPENVAIIDERGKLISAKSDEDFVTEDGTAAERMAARVERMLEARVGAGNAVVEVSIERVTERESIVERLVDPDSRVAISSETQENSATARNSEAGMTVASDLPENAGANGGDSSENSNETVERVNYEVSETRREVLRTPGAIKRLTVAVLVNGVAGEDGAIVPRDTDEMTALTALVEDIVGFDEGRGDEITVQSMAFVGAETAAATPAPGWLAASAPSANSVIRMGILALVALVLGLFVLRPLLRKPEPIELPQLAELPMGGFGMAPLDGEIDDGLGFQPLSTDIGGPSMEASDDPVTRMRALIDARKDETMTILRNWLEDEKEQET
ncbi:flagellar basal-body MS-ring/collar protein FliF [Donghicola mangrovi]|uniref:Flagellar M-ring protein n=1 Tax=Donghicola mangrovi TaxID=2729614 RepID=A0A850Q7W2_9RHOB|nr:flagellar M-ring protein FliF [Donghicola mangrovi]